MVANAGLARVPRPGSGPAAVAVAPERPAKGYWAGAPSGVLAGGVTYLAYRLRGPEGRGTRNVVARSEDGIRFEPLVVLDKDRFGAESLERPALVRTAGGRWRLYVSCATPGTKHWRVDLLEAADIHRLGDAVARTVLPGDERTGVKDPVVRASRTGWELWACLHPLDVPGAEDRMSTAYATSPDGVAWTWHGTALAGTPGRWDARGARVTAVLPDSPGPVAYYDGRASPAENFEERTGLAVPAEGTSLAALRALRGPPATAAGRGLRYLDVLPSPGGGYRLYYEASRPDGAHELRTEHCPG